MVVDAGSILLYGLKAPVGRYCDGGLRGALPVGSCHFLAGYPVVGIWNL